MFQLSQVMKIGTEFIDENINGPIEVNLNPVVK